MYKSGFDYSILSHEINALNESTDVAKVSCPEEELIAAKLTKGGNYGEWLSITMIIQVLIAETKYNNLSNTRVGMYLTNAGFERKRMKINGVTVTAYNIHRVGQAVTSTMF